MNTTHVLVTVLLIVLVAVILWLNHKTKKPVIYGTNALLSSLRMENGFNLSSSIGGLYDQFSVAFDDHNHLLGYITGEKQTYLGFEEIIAVRLASNGEQTLRSPGNFDAVDVLLITNNPHVGILKINCLDKKMLNDHFNGEPDDSCYDEAYNEAIETATAIIHEINKRRHWK